MSIEDLKATRDRLERIERTTGNSGAVPRTPKQLMLDASEIEKGDPEHKYRWVNVRDPQKAQARIMEGYTPIAEGEGGRTLGGALKLMKIPREVHLARIADQKREHKLRLNAHRTELENLAEGIARELRDRHGINVDAERILVSE